MTGSTAASPRRVPKPGPGAYELPSCFPSASTGSYMSGSSRSQMSSQTRSTMSQTGRDEATLRSDATGPGQYHPNHDVGRKRIANYGFGGGSNRLLSEPNKKLVTPSPDRGQQDNGQFHRAPNHGFGSETKGLRIPGCLAFSKDEAATLEEKSKCKRPGPGSHNPSHSYSSKVATSPASSMTSRLETHTNERTFNPGPGNYGSPRSGEGTEVVNSLHVSPRGQFGTAARMKIEPKRTPGPGAYETEIAAQTAPKWSMTGRPEFGRDWENTL